MMIDERINIVPILAADISDDMSSINNQFSEISFKKGTQGEFFIDFITNAIIKNKYRVKYVLFRKIDDNLQVLFIDSFVIPPSEEFLAGNNIKHKKTETGWSFGDGDIIFGHTKAKMTYDTINRSGEYGILAFASQIDDDTDDVDLEPNNLICERHFMVNIEE